MITFESVLNTLFYVGAIQGLILSIILFNVKNNRFSNRLLGILTFLWAVILTVFALQSVGIYNRFPHLIRIFYQLLFAWFPLLYLSVKYLFSFHNKFNRSDILHFLPMFISILLNIPFFLKSAEEKLSINGAGSGYYYMIELIGGYVISLQGIVYSILSFRVINRYKKRVVNLRSSLDEKIISGYKTGVIMALSAWCIGIVGNEFEKRGLSTGVDLFVFVYLIFVAIIYWLSILTLRSPEVFKLSKDEATAVLPERANEDGLTGETFIGTEPGDGALLFQNDKELSELNDRLIEFLEKEKSFLDPNLSLEDLAKKLGVGRHKLSAVINQFQKMNFFELINSYRVKEVKRMMANPAESSKKMYELGYDAGFNSKASFYRVFKQMTHKTPVEFRATVRSRSLN